MKRQLRFIMMTTFYPPYHFGGDAVYVRRLAEALARRGHEIHVIHNLDAFRILASAESQSAAREAGGDDGFSGVTIHRLESSWPMLASLAIQQTGHPQFHSRKIRHLIREIEPDVIHYHNLSLVGGPGLLAYGHAVKLYTAHEQWLVCPTHLLWRHGREICEARQCLRCQLRHRRPPQLWRATGLLESKAEHVDVFIGP